MYYLSAKRVPSPFDAFVAEIFLFEKIICVTITSFSLLPAESFEIFEGNCGLFLINCCCIQTQTLI